MLAQARQVQRGAVAFVLVEAVLRILRVQRHQRGVARGLGEDGGGRNGFDLVVAADDGDALDLHHRAAVAVDQGQRRHGAQRFHRAAHGQHRGLQDVELVDFFFRRFGDRPGQRVLLDQRRQHVALGFVEFFESRRPSIGRAGSRMTAAATPGRPAARALPRPRRR
jgi:hypothetical protein